MEENKCACCGATEDLQIHHWLYLNTIRKQKTWTTILCRACHQKLHPNHGVGHGAKKFGRKVISKLKVVNCSSEAHRKIMQQRRKMEDGRRRRQGRVCLGRFRCFAWYIKQKEVIKMEKVNIIAALLVAVIAVVSVTPYAIAETEGAQLEFTDFYPASLTYDVGEELAVVCKIYNSGTEVVEDATVCINVISPNGTYVYDFNFDIGEEGFMPNKSIRSHSRYLFLVDENATAGKYTIEAILRWGSDAFQRNSFFYVPEVPVQTEPGLEIVSLYTQRLLYQPGDDILCTCRMKNNVNESIDYYISMCMFNPNGTLIKSMASGVYSQPPGKKAINKFIFGAISEPGMYTVEGILWWNDIATAKTAKFGVDN